MAIFKVPYDGDIIAEYGMWGLDFLRVNEYIKGMNFTAHTVNSQENPRYDDLLNYYSMAEVTYGELRPYIRHEHIILMFDKFFRQVKEIKGGIERRKKFGSFMIKRDCLKLRDLLNNIKYYLMITKQAVGLGVPMRKKFNTKSRIGASSQSILNAEELEKI